MDPPKYNGTMHPEEWIQQFKASYYYNNTSGNEVYLCKQLIHPAIKIPSIENISTYDELLNALKAHVSFAIFKESCKKKLLELTYIPEKNGGDTAAFLSKFQTLCYNAEINNIEEIKFIIYKIIFVYMHNDLIKSEFIRKSKEIKSIEELLKLFNDITTYESILIKHGSYVAIKHAATGKYLSSVLNLDYETGSFNQAVFAGKTSLELNAIWFIYDNQSRSNVFYDDIYLLHQQTSRRLRCTSYKSLSNYSEVSCYNNSSDNYYTIWKLKQYNSTNNCEYVKSQDRIILQNNYLKKILRSHELEFTINNEKFKEVVCHDERIGGNDEWIIELIDTHLLQYLCDISKYIV